MGCCETPKYTFSETSARLVDADWQKSGLNLKIPPKTVVLPLWTLLTKEVSTFLIIIANLGSL